MPRYVKRISESLVKCVGLSVLNKTTNVLKYSSKMIVESLLLAKFNSSPTLRHSTHAYSLVCSFSVSIIHFLLSYLFKDYIKKATTPRNFIT